MLARAALLTALSSLLVVIPATARADDHAPLRVGVAVAPVAVGLFGVGTDGHYGTSSTAFGGRIGVGYAPDPHFRVGIDGSVLAPYGGKVVYYSPQLAVRGALPFGDAFELGLTARFGPGFARIESGIAQSTSTMPYGPGPAVGYSGWQGGLAIDATVWLQRNLALVFAVEAIVGNEKNTAGDGVYLGYLQGTLGPGAIAPWIGLELGL